MICLRYLCLFFISIVLFFFNFNSFAEDVLSENKVNIFQKGCWPTQGFDIELRFAPVRKRLEEEKSEDQWSYKFTTDDKKYPENRIKLPKDGSSVRVDLVLLLNKSESKIEESYLWTVIAGPRNTGWRFGGFWPTEKKSMKDFDRLSDKKESLIKIEKFLKKI